MAAITDEQIITVRSYVGEKWLEADISDRYDKFFLLTSDEDSALYLTTVEVLRAAEARMTLDKPTSVSAEGMSVSYVTNLTTLRQRISELEAVGTVDPEEGGIKITKLKRASTR